MDITVKCRFVKCFTYMEWTYHDITMLVRDNLELESMIQSQIFHLREQPFVQHAFFLEELARESVSVELARQKVLDEMWNKLDQKTIAHAEDWEHTTPSNHYERTYFLHDSKETFVVHFEPESDKVIFRRNSNDF